MAVDLRVESGPVGRVVRPDAPAGSPVVLYLHGDRHLSDEPVAGEEIAARLAGHLDASVVCCTYRATFPAALDDVHQGFAYCAERGPVAVVGNRLGGGLAAALLLSLRDLGAEPPRCAVLISGLLDLTLEASSLSLNSAADPAFDVAELRRQAVRYAAGTNPTEPLLSPVRGNLHGLPPVQLLVAGTDPLLDDSLAFATRAARDGVTVDLRVQPDAVGHRLTAPPAMAEFIHAWTVGAGAGVVRS